MKKSEVIISSLAVIFISLSFVNAQDKPILVHPSEKAVFLHWKNKDGTQKFNIYKKRRGDQKAVKINDKPIEKMGHRNDIVNVLGEETVTFLKMFKVTYPEQIHAQLDKSPMADVLNTAMLPSIARIRGCGYLDENVSPNTSYEYEIKIVTNREVSYSDPIQVVTENNVPVKPSKFITTGQNEKIHLFFEPGKGPNAGFDIFRSESREGEYTQINEQRVLKQRATDPKSPPDFIDTDVQVEKMYYYKIAGRDVLGNLGEFSDSRSAVAFDKTPPSSPKLQKLKLDRVDKVQLTWTHENPGDVKSFSIYKSTSTMDYGKPIVQKLPTGKMYYQDSASGAGLFWYRIVAVDSYGNEAFSNAEGALIK